jgi:nucleotide-binding universal stress UspA family protein
MHKKILAPLDDSAGASRVLDEAVSLARACGATLRLLHVVDDYPALVRMTSAENYERLRRELRVHGENLLSVATRTALERHAATESVLREVAHRRVADLILEEAASAGCDLIVMGTHGRRGLAHLMLGSEAETVARSSPVPVLLVREPPPR